MDEFTGSWFDKSSEDDDDSNNSNEYANEEKVTKEDFYETDINAAPAHCSRAQNAAAITATFFAESRDDDGDGEEPKDDDTADTTTEEAKNGEDGSRQGYILGSNRPLNPLTLFAHLTQTWEENRQKNQHKNMKNAARCMRRIIKKNQLIKKRKAGSRLIRHRVAEGDVGRKNSRTCLLDAIKQILPPNTDVEGLSSMIEAEMPKEGDTSIMDIKCALLEHSLILEVVNKTYIKRGGQLFIYSWRLVAD